MKRLGLVMFVCLCLQISGVSTPFAHLHADADHETSHHDGRVAHRHVAPHQSTGHLDAGHHHGESSEAELVVADEVASIDVAGESVVRGVGGTVGRVPHPPVAQSPPDGQLLAVRPPGRVVVPATDVGRRSPPAPDLSSSSLRGPPR